MSGGNGLWSWLVCNTIRYDNLSGITRIMGWSGGIVGPGNMFTLTASVFSFAKNANIFFRISHIFAKINFATGSQKMLSFVKRTDIRQFREKFKKFSPFLRDFALTCFAKKMQIHEFNHIFCYFSHLFSMNGMGEMHVHMPNFSRQQAHWNNLNDNSNSLGARNFSV